LMRVMKAASRSALRSRPMQRSRVRWLRR
jgi:hypothetical protein